MIILHEYPLSIVEHHGFREYSHSLQPIWKPISRATVKRDIIKIYDVEKKKMMDMLENNKSRVAITSDMWKSGNQNKGFMAVTCHFIDDNWYLHSKIIR